MIRLLITEAAFIAIAGCAPSEEQRHTGAGRYGRAPAGTVAIWLDTLVVETLWAMRERGESYSDTIIRYAASC